MEQKFFELIEIITQEDLLSTLGWGTTTMWDQIRVKDSPFAWVKGIHYFQCRERGKLTFNRRMIAVWLVAKSQNDPEIHLRAVDLFQQSIPGTPPVRRRKDVS